jgi:hypothetical protein
MNFERRNVMAIQISIWERRDNGSREIMGSIALELCRILRKKSGINSARFYWAGSEEIMFLCEGEESALDSIPRVLDWGPEYAKLAFALADIARLTLNKQLITPQTAAQNYQLAGR